MASYPFRLRPSLMFLVIQSPLPYLTSYLTLPYPMLGYVANCCKIRVAKKQSGRCHATIEWVAKKTDASHQITLRYPTLCWDTLQIVAKYGLRRSKVVGVMRLLNELQKKKSRRVSPDYLTLPYPMLEYVANCCKIRVAKKQSGRCHATIEWVAKKTDASHQITLRYPTLCWDTLQIVAKYRLRRSKILGVIRLLNEL